MSGKPSTAKIVDAGDALPPGEVPREAHPADGRLKVIAGRQGMGRQPQRLRPALNASRTMARATILAALRRLAGAEASGRPASSPLPIAETELLSRARLGSAAALKEAIDRGLIPAEVDTEEADITGLHYSSILAIGAHHQLDAEECQDAIECLYDEQCFIAVLADGVGSVRLSHFGARLMVKESAAVTAGLVQGRLDQHKKLLDEEFLAELYTELYKASWQLINESGLPVVRAFETFLATTLQILIITPLETIVLALGDGYVRWGGICARIDERTRRLPALCATGQPPLLATAAVIDSSPTAFTGYGGDLRERLLEDALCLHIVGYGPTQEVLADGLTMASDGLRFALAEEGNFPLEDLLARFDGPIVAGILKLFNATVAPANAEESVTVFTRLLSEDSGTPAVAAWAAHVRAALTDHYIRVFGEDANLRAILETMPLDSLLMGKEVRDDSRRYTLLRRAAALNEVARKASAYLLRTQYSVDVLQTCQPVIDDVSLVCVKFARTAHQGTGESAKKGEQAAPVEPVRRKSRPTAVFSPDEIAKYLKAYEWDEASSRHGKGFDIWAPSSHKSARPAKAPARQPCAGESQKVVIARPPENVDQQEVCVRAHVSVRRKGSTRAPNSRFTPRRSIVARLFNLGRR